MHSVMANNYNAYTPSPRFGWSLPAVNTEMLLNSAAAVKNGLSDGVSQLSELPIDKISGPSPKTWIDWAKQQKMQRQLTQDPNQLQADKQSVSETQQEEQKNDDKASPQSPISPNASEQNANVPASPEIALQALESPIGANSNTAVINDLQTAQQYNQAMSGCGVMPNASSLPEGRNPFMSAAIQGDKSGF